MSTLHELLQPTARLRLRLLQPDDEALYCSLYTDPLTMRMIGPPLSSAQARADFHRALRASSSPSPLVAKDAMPRRQPALSLPWELRSSPCRGLRVIAETLDASTVVALYGLECWTPSGSEWEMGVMAPRLAHGRGYAVEGMSALTERLLAIGASRVLLRCRPDNLAACRVARRMGFRGQVTATGEGPVMLWARSASDQA